MRARVSFTFRLFILYTLNVDVFVRRNNKRKKYNPQWKTQRTKSLRAFSGSFRIDYATHIFGSYLDLISFFVQSKSGRRRKKKIKRNRLVDGRFPESSSPLPPASHTRYLRFLITFRLVHNHRVGDPFIFLFNVLTDSLKTLRLTRAGNVNNTMPRRRSYYYKFVFSPFKAVGQSNFSKVKSDNPLLASSWGARA